MKRVKEVRGAKTVYQVFSRVTGGLVYRDELTDGETTNYASAGGAAIRLVRTAGGTPTADYSHFDAQGSVVADTRTLGVVLWRESYEPFGRTRLNPAANANDTGYTGHLRDAASGLIYMQARYMDPLIGRFYSTDPVGYQDQLNLYAYVANDPVNLTDPNGEQIGDRFDDPEAAAIDAVESINPQSVEENVEYGGTIQREVTASRDAGGDVKTTTQYYATDAERGDGDSGELSTFDPDTTVGEYHTHGDYSRLDENFDKVRATQAEDPGADKPSDFDRAAASERRSATRDARSVYGERYVAKLGTPSGEIEDY